MRHQARKRFGQNFLSDEDVIDRIISLIRPRQGDAMLEIGPGLGALTFKLLEEVDHLHAIEVDRDLAKHLKEKTAVDSYSGGVLSLINEDVLTVNIDQIGNNLRIIGNLPYNISTPIILHLLKSHASIKDMCFMLQKEVVERMTAPPNTKAYGRLSVVLQYLCEVTPHFIVPPEAFTPAPRVHSQMVMLSPYVAPPHGKTCFETLQSVVKQAFGMRRKTLKNNLKGLLSPEDFEQLELAPSARPETLSVQQFVNISEFLRQRH